MKHIPVLLNEVIESLNPKPGNFFIDGTVDGGGHAREIIKKIEPGGIFLGIDWDESMVERLKESMESKKAKIILVHSNYKNIQEILKKNNLPKADGLLLDLGFSSEQIEESKRGFSFLKDEVLDMRYSREAGVQSAAEVVNSLSENDLADIFYKYGEERFSRRIAKKIVEERRRKKIFMTSELVGIIRTAVPKSYERGRIHPATRIFQALRIYVNRELENVETILENLREIINSGGRVAIITFHSLEDRLVKHYFRKMEKENLCKILTKKPIVPSEEETKSNPRSRSSKLRVIQIL